MLPFVFPPPPGNFGDEFLRQVKKMRILTKLQICIGGPLYSRIHLEILEKVP
jgi:hypothetical protein